MVKDLVVWLILIAIGGVAWWIVDSNPKYNKKR